MIFYHLEMGDNFTEVGGSATSPPRAGSGRFENQVKNVPKRIILTGLAIGCGLGFGAAFAKDELSPSFRRPEEAETL